jgi:nucleoside-diphosphate-sugar epimerase
VGDIEDPAWLAASMRGAAWIVHAAGITRARSAADFDRVNVKGTERVLRAALDAGPGLTRFVLVSSQAAAGPSTDGRPVGEGARPAPVSAYGVSKLRAEELLFLMRDRFPVVSIRPPAVYGPRDDALLKAFIAVKRHLRPELKRGGTFSMVHAEDLARAICQALTDDRAVGETFFVAAPEVTDYAEVGAELERALGTWAVPLRLPMPILYAGAVVAEVLAALARRPAVLSRQKLREITAGDWICSSAKIRARLGWEPEVTLADGLRRTTDWYRAEHWL